MKLVGTVCSLGRSMYTYIYTRCPDIVKIGGSRSQPVARSGAGNLCWSVSIRELVRSCAIIGNAMTHAHLTLTPLPVPAVVVAAGMSRRMGEFKQLLPWGDVPGNTVIRQVVANLASAGADPVLAVLGHRAEDVAGALAGSPARTVVAAEYAEREMVGSLQTGLGALLKPGNPAWPGTLLALGDQPHIPVSVIRAVLDQVEITPDKVVIPSHAMRRGHPIWLPRALWAGVLDLAPGATLREVLARPAMGIVYVAVETPAVLLDMDTPAMYQQLRGEELSGR